MLERRGEPNEIDDAKMIELYESDLWKADYLLKNSPHFEPLQINYREVLDAPEDHGEALHVDDNTAELGRDASQLPAGVEALEELHRLAVGPGRKLTVDRPANDGLLSGRSLTSCQDKNDRNADAAYHEVALLLTDLSCTDMGSPLGITRNRARSCLTRDPPGKASGVSSTSRRSIVG